MSKGDKIETENWNVYRVYLTVARKVSDARDRYEELFGVAHDSRDLKNEFSALFEDAIINDKSDVKVPLRIALALYLRPGMGRGSGNQGKTNRQHRYEQWLKRRVKARKADLVGQKVKPKVADDLILEDFRNRRGDFAPHWGIDQLKHFDISETKVLRMLGRKE